MSGEGSTPAAWNPWAALRARPDVRFALERLPAGVYGAYATRGALRGILVGRDLGRRQRKATLAHELVHDEWGGGCPAHDLPEEMAVVARRHERRVDREVARRLVPLDGLRTLIACIEANELPWGVVEIAEAFDVPEYVAAEAVALLG